MIGELSRFRLAWDALILALVFVSCTIIPYQFTFLQDRDNTFLWALLLIDVLFIVDILLNFLTSYSSHGVEVTDRRSTVRHYLRGRFTIDLVASFPLELFLWASGDPLVYGLSSVLLIRLLHLLRVSRMFVILSRWEALNWTNPGHLKIMKFAGFITLVTHWIACAWFMTAVADGFPKDSWVMRAGIDAAQPISQYVRSLYWTITTMTTVGYGDITPGRTAEYLVASAVMLMGASLYAFLIGSVASLLSNLNVAKSRHRERIQSVTQYLYNRSVPHQLNTRVRNYYEYLWERYQGVREGALLEDLPAPLRLDIMGHLARNILTTVPLFKYSPEPLRDQLLMSLEPQTYPPDTYVIRENRVGNEIYFITQGSVEITTDNGSNVHGTFGPGDYFGYMSLVLNEKRTASIRTLDYCDMLLLNRSKFESIREEFPEFQGVLKRMSAERTEKLSALVMDGIVL